MAVRESSLSEKSRVRLTLGLLCAILVVVSQVSWALSREASDWRAWRANSHKWHTDTDGWMRSAEVRIQALERTASVLAEPLKRPSK